MRKVCIVTGTRAEFGLLRNLMTEVRDHPDLTLQTIVTGAHLADGHGTTIKELEAEGIAVDETVHMLLASDQPEAVAASLGLGTIGISKALSRLAPDIVVLLGDRYETLAAAQSAMMLGLPIAHIHGGEATEGLIDEAIRHSITKMAHLHFVAAAPFRDRVIQLGEQPDRVFVVGAMGLDNIATLAPLSRSELERDLGLALTPPVLLVTYHPVTLDSRDGGDAMPLLDALEATDGGTVVFTGSNADPRGSLINRQIASFCARNPSRSTSVASLGFRRYLSLMGEADCVVGNSSSGLLEAPAMGVPTVDIGPRQAGRPRAASVINCGADRDEILAALDHCLSPAHRAIAARRETPYGTPGAARRVADRLAAANLEGILMKSFYNLPA